eukprot:TRINITY_DN978_c0_g1_i9.p1 TRINITY_DN978_c0_g1~~TRINITY_DN978_c0_g1_i9.p1  ORF type:complete len:345 (+),score=76.92 TRINITY_DN978_c0_g1_i9:914-1948(+)
MADDPFEEEFGISIEEMGFDPREIRSQESYDALTEAQKNMFSNIRYEGSLAPEERKKIADKRKKKKLEEKKKKEAAKATDERREAEERALLHPDKKNVFVPLWDGFDQVSFSTLVDVLRTGGFNICTGVIRPPSSSMTHIGSEDLKVTSKSGVSLVGDFLFELKGNANFLKFDAIIIPAGKNMDRHLASNKKFTSLIKFFNAKKKFVCGAEDAVAFIFLYQGVLKGRSCTGSETTENEIRNSIPAELGKSVTFKNSETIVLSDNVITSRSSADAVEFALAILSNIKGSSAMVDVARKLKYNTYCDKVKKATKEPELKPEDTKKPTEDNKPPETESKEPEDAIEE